MPAQVTLTIVEDNIKGKQFIFDSRNTCIIGRGNDCNIQLPDDKYHSTISRYHCLLDINPPDIRIRDFGSLNGTNINGRCIGRRNKNQTPKEGQNLNFSECDLQDGDLITLGNTVLQVTIEPGIAFDSTFISEKELNKLTSSREFQTDSNLGSIKCYNKIRMLGKGGFGEVYLACHDKTQELVAIKTMLPQVSVKPYLKNMFLREVRNMKTLNHPNLVDIKECGFYNGVFFLAMEYCNRGSVMDLIEERKGKLTIKEATNIILQILDGLHYAHTEKGLVHRDIKPGNIFLTVTDGKLVAKLGDYGLAKAFDLSGLSGQTATGTIIGSPFFMPRQQVLDFKYVKPEVDIWSIAATLYFMLTLKFPRDFESDEHPMSVILKSQPIPIQERDGSISQPLANLIDFALKDDSNLNFKTAWDFKIALMEVI